MEEALIKRVMPHDEEAESSVIGAMLIDNEAIMVASEIITGDDFYQRQLGIVFDTMVELYNAGKPVECRLFFIPACWKRTSGRSLRCRTDSALDGSGADLCEY